MTVETAEEIQQRNGGEKNMGVDRQIQLAILYRLEQIKDKLPNGNVYGGPR